MPPLPVQGSQHIRSRQQRRHVAQVRQESLYTRANALLQRNANTDSGHIATVMLVRRLLVRDAPARGLLSGTPVLTAYESQRKTTRCCVPQDFHYKLVFFFIACHAQPGSVDVRPVVSSKADDLWGSERARDASNVPTY